MIAVVDDETTTANTLDKRNVHTDATMWVRTRVRDKSRTSIRGAHRPTRVVGLMFVVIVIPAAQ